jgi:hypothetical protein
VDSQAQAVFLGLAVQAAHLVYQEQVVPAAHQVLAAQVDSQGVPDKALVCLTIKPKPQSQADILVTGL